MRLPLLPLFSRDLYKKKAPISTFCLVQFILFLFVWTGCSTQTKDRDSEILLKVNGVERTVYDFESTYVEHLIATGRSDSKEERSAHLNKMIDAILLSQSAMKKGLTDHPIYRSAVQHEERKSMLDSYFVDQMEQEIAPLTDDEIRLAYAKRLRKVYVRQLYSKDPAELDTAWLELESGEAFVDVANRFYQTASYDSMAGYLGPISYFGIDDAVAEAAFSIPQGAYSKPVRSRLGYHILYVEYIEFPALLAEDEYQYRKQGVESQLRLRRQRLVSSSYVYDEMSRLDVQTNRENLLRLSDVIKDLDGEGLYLERPNPESNENVWTDSRVASLAGFFDRDVELATYTVDGEPQVFTFGEYIDWLPYLSFQESKVRLGASIGRGMRNQVLYERALNEGYDQDERVKKSVHKRATDILSELNQYELTKAALQDTQRVQVPDEFRSRLISSRDLLLKAGYWKLPAESLQSAQKIMKRLAQGEKPADMTGYVRVDVASLNENESDYDLVMKSVLNTPVISYAADQGWLVLQVDEREVEEIATETRVADLERSYKVYDAIKSEVDSLRNLADIEIDTELFNEMYQVWSPGR